MKTGYRGTFVISWTQTELDGLWAAPIGLLGTGAAWRWTGEAVRVDGPQSLLLLSGDPEGADLRRRAARMVKRLVGAALANRPLRDADDAPAEEPDGGFVLTDGRRVFEVTVIDAPDGAARLLMFLGEMPPADRNLWVVRSSLAIAEPAADAPRRAGVICFTPGTRIATPEGARRIEDLAPGDRILTKDNGAQQVLWTGSRRMTGARLYAMPHLRPIRFRQGALGIGRPDGDLLVSPQHRMLVRGAAARALFNTDEVLVAAEDLVNDLSVTVDAHRRDVTYVHILLEHHQIVWANGLETESYHPSNTSLETIDPVQRAALFAAMPELEENPQIYGGHVRRNLSASEAAILRHERVA